MTWSFHFLENKHMIKIVFTTQLFLFKIPNNITYVLPTNYAFLYTINGTHEESMSLTNGIWKKMNKN